MCVCGTTGIVIKNYIHRYGCIYKKLCFSSLCITVSIMDSRLALLLFVIDYDS